MDDKRPCPFCGMEIFAAALKCRYCQEMLSHGKVPGPGGAPGPQSPALVNRDEEHLKMLSIFYYVIAAMAGCFATFPILHFIFGIIMALNPDSMNGGPGGGSGPPAGVGWAIAGVAGAFILFGWAGAFCLFLTGRYLGKRKNHMFCLVMAGIACLNIPLGTVLGVFSFIVLLRPSVKELFGLPPTPGPGSGV